MHAVMHAITAEEARHLLYICDTTNREVAITNSTTIDEQLMHK
jgi:hypothetical protein